MSLFYLLQAFFICINVGLYVGAPYMASAGFPNPGNVPFPNYYNATNGNTGTVTQELSNPTNSTSGGAFNWFTQGYEIIQKGTESVINGITNIGTTAINALSGAFIISVLNASFFHFPTEFVVGMQVIIGLLLVAQIAYYVTGRFGGALTS